MKKIINLLIVVSIILTSCTTIVFKEVTPKKGNELKIFPKELIGNYTDVQNKETLVIDQDSFQYGNKNTLFHLKEKLTDNSTVLKKEKDYYILNLKSKNDDNWGVVPFKYKDDKIYVYYLILDKETKDKEEAERYKKEQLNKLNLITNVEPIKDTTNKAENYVINPTDKEFNKILSNDFFVEIMEFNRLK